MLPHKRNGAEQAIRSLMSTARSYTISSLHTKPSSTYGYTQLRRRDDIMSLGCPNTAHVACVYDMHMYMHMYMYRPGGWGYYYKTMREERGGRC